MLPQSQSDTLSDRYLLGSRSYELTNHLGNVLSVITDKKIGVSSGGGSTIDYYKAEVLSQPDYYVFGMTQPGRQYHTVSQSGVEGYRYGFNGKENETDIPGWQDYGMREYDRRTGMFLSVDPLASKYPYYTPYAFAGNKPIWATDLDGKEERYYTYDLNINNRGKIRVNNFREIKYINLSYL